LRDADGDAARLKAVNTETKERPRICSSNARAVLVLTEDTAGVAGA